MIVRWHLIFYMIRYGKKSCLIFRYVQYEASLCNELFWLVTSTSSVFGVGAVSQGDLVS
jgi:hypothetical protein